MTLAKCVAGSKPAYSPLFSRRTFSIIALGTARLVFHFCVNHADLMGSNLSANQLWSVNIITI